MGNSVSSNRELELLVDFTSVASAVTDVQSLMTHLFNLLRREAGFDICAYLISYESYSEGRIYAARGVEKPVVERFTRYLRSKGAELCPGLEGQSFPSLKVSVLSGADSGAPKGESKVLRFPLECWGRTIGAICLARLDGAEIKESSPLVSRMAEVASRVLERIFANMFAEEKKLTDVILSMNEGVYIVDREGSFAAINPKGFELLSEFCGKDVDMLKRGLKIGSVEAGHDWGDCEFIEFARKVTTLEDDLGSGPHTEEISNNEGRILLLSATRLATDGAGKFEYVITAKDVTDERELQERIMLSSKLASLGEMAAGIAHEINNPLQAILLNIEMLKLKAQEKELMRLESIEDGITRIKTIVKDLLIFAREDTTDTENVDINFLIEKAVDILRHQLNIANVDVTLELDEKPLIVECNRNLFQQVVINLLQNSKDAIEESGKGSTVKIATGLDGDQIRIMVTDNGPGIPEKIIGKIFNPFLTTKDVGKGTGLGLSVSRKIIEGIGGKLYVRSTPGEFTEFTIDLPFTGSVMEERRVQRRREPDLSMLANRKILMVDDEAEVLSTVSESIGKFVDRIESHTDTAAALESIRARDYDLILLDIKMPGTGGMELFKMITDIKPHLSDRVVFLSGDTESEKTGEFLSTTHCRYLSKPFSARELLSTMCEALSKKGAVAEG